jgi:hypothetical protein
MVPPVLFEIGPVEITATVAYTLVASGIVVAFSLLARWGLHRGPAAWAVIAEFLVEHLEGVMRDMFGRDASPFVSLVVTLRHRHEWVEGLLQALPGTDATAVAVGDYQRTLANRGPRSAAVREHHE